MNRYLLLLGVSLLLAGCGESGEKAVVHGNEPEAPSSQSDQPTKVSIPFLLTEFNNISVPAIVNREDKVNLMFHTAVSDISLTKDATAKMTAVNLDETANVNSWGGDTTARHGSGNTIQIGEFVFDDLMITECELSGHHTEGKFGPNLFAGKIVEIDFEHSVLNIFSSLPEIENGYEKLDVVVRNRSMYVTAQIEVNEVTYENELLVHSGFSGSVLLDDEFAGQHKLAEKLETISESELKDSFGNVLKTKKAILPRMQIGSTSFANLPIGFFDGAIGRQKMSVLGGDVLKRFNIIIDLKNSHLYLKPNGLFDSEFKS